jgi:hypothetical protein
MPDNHYYEFFSHADYLLCPVADIRDALEICRIPVLKEKISKNDNAPRKYVVHLPEILPEKMQELASLMDDYGVQVRKIPFAVF